MAKKGQKYRTFTRQQKIKAVKMVLEEGKSLNEVEIGYLGYKKNTGALNRWIIEYNQEGEKNAFKKKKGIKKVEKTEESMRYEILKKFKWHTPTARFSPMCRRRCVASCRTDKGRWERCSRL